MRAFIARYEQVVFAVLSRIVTHRDDVQDLAQETFLRAIHSVGRFDATKKAKLSTWLCTIATRVALDHLRKEQTRKRLTPMLSAVDRRTPERLSKDQELRKAIQVAVEALPGDQRAAFVLAEFHGLSHREIGEAINAPEATVKTRLFRAREKLRHTLAKFREEDH